MDNGFFDLSVTASRTVLKACDVEIGEGVPLFEIIFNMAQKKNLKKTNAGALEIANGRLARMRGGQEDMASALLQINECWEVMGQQDREKMLDAQAQEAREAIMREDFAFSYQRKCATLRKQKQLNAPDPPPPGPIPSTIPQAGAKLYAPPGAKIWRGLQRCESSGAST